MAAKKPAERPNVSKDELLKYYRDMLLIRRFEEKAGQLYGMGLIGGFCHLYIGQEAVAVGVQESVKQGHDKIITGYRDHGHMLAAGMAIAAEGGILGFALSAIIGGAGAAASTPASSHLLGRVSPRRYAPLVFSIKQTAVPAGLLSRAMTQTDADTGDT